MSRQWCPSRLLALCAFRCKCNDLSLLGAKQTLRVRIAFLFPASRHLTACLEQKFNNQHCEGGWIMTYDVDAAIADFAIERLRTERRRQTERSSSNQGMTPAIKMLIGDWPMSSAY